MPKKNSWVNLVLAYSLGTAVGVGGACFAFKDKISSLEEALRFYISANASNAASKPKEDAQKGIQIIRLDDFIEGDFEESLIMVQLGKIGGRDRIMQVRASEYLDYRNRSHVTTSSESFANYVTYGSETIKKISQELTSGIKSDEASAQKILDFVNKSIIYDWTIEKERNYARYPLETLVERNGDCEDMAILAASLMKSKGIDVIFVEIPGSPGHIGVGISGGYKGKYYELEGRKYYYANAAGISENQKIWKIGEIPKEYLDKEVKLIKIP